MKKVVLVVMLFVLAFCLMACDGTTPATNAPTTTADPSTTTVPGSDVVTTAPTTTENPDVKKETTENYEAILNQQEWVNDGSIDYSKFTDFGTGSSIVTQITKDYQGYQKVYYTLNEDGSRNEMNSIAAKAFDTVGAVVTADDKAKTVEIQLTPIEVYVQSTWTEVTAKAGSYLMFDFYTNADVDFYMTVTAKPAGAASSAYYTQDGVTVKKAGTGRYSGVAKCTVPYRAGETFYINICLDNSSSKYPVMATIPVNITTAKYDSQYSLMFQGDWELVRDEEYLPNLVDLFYNVYPRLYKRFAFGTEPKTITFVADKNYDGVAYCAGTRVVVSTAYANSNPNDLGFFSHEITHSVQQYNKLENYGGTTTYNGKTAPAWWTENMANYGGFRYFHWGYSTKFVQIYNVQTNTGLQDWGYEAYGDGSKLFLSYLDWKFPTTDENGNGTIEVEEYGVIDLINYTIKTATKSFNDNPYNPNSPFNKAVYTATDGRFDCIEAIRVYYANECKTGTWKFVGFRDYKDNFITLDLPGIPNPTFPMLEDVVKGDKTATALSTPVTEGTNILTGATVVDYSGQQALYPVSNLLDGDITTKWQVKKGATGDKKYELGGYQHELILDLGETKTFNTYTLVNAGSKEQATFNTREWEIFISDDGVNWTSIDYQEDVNEGIVSFNVGDQSARYVKLRIFRADRNNVGTVRLYEFMMYDVK